MTLVTTGDHDDRVPAHSFKFAARLQAVQSCSNPVLIRLRRRSDMGPESPRARSLRKAATVSPSSPINWG